MKIVLYVLCFATLAACTLRAEEASKEPVYLNEGIRVVREKAAPASEKLNSNLVVGDFWYWAELVPESFPEDRYFKIVIQYETQKWSSEETETKTPYFDVRGDGPEEFYRRESLSWERSERTLWVGRHKANVKIDNFANFFDDRGVYLGQGMALRSISCNIIDLGRHMPADFPRREGRVDVFSDTESATPPYRRSSEPVESAVSFH